MARPKNEQPTPAELDVLKLLWEQGPATVRQVMELLKNQNKDRAYTSVMSLMNVMAEKKLLNRKPHGRAFLYEANYSREKTLSGLLGDLCNRAFQGSASMLVTHLLEQSNPDDEELAEIRKVIKEYNAQKGKE